MCQSCKRLTNILNLIFLHTSFVNKWHLRFHVKWTRGWLEVNKSKRVVNLILYVYDTGISNKTIRSKCKILLSLIFLKPGWQWWIPICRSGLAAGCRLRLKCDGTRAETRFRLSAKRTSPFKSAGASFQSTTGSRGVRTSSSNAGHTKFWGMGRVLSTHSIRQSPLQFPSRTSPCAITFQLDSTFF
jgi:hypothetical protein